MSHLTEKGILTRHSNHRKGDSWEATELLTLLNKFETAVKDVD